MGNATFILEYVQACTAGTPAFVDCGPVWQCGVIAVLLVLAIAAFLALFAARVRDGTGLAAG